MLQNCVQTWLPESSLTHDAGREMPFPVRSLDCHLLCSHGWITLAAFLPALEAGSVMLLLREHKSRGASALSHYQGQDTVRQQNYVAVVRGRPLFAGPGSAGQVLLSTREVSGTVWKTD
jgi:hypothetical protein